MRGQITDIIKGFQGMSQVRQVQKWQLAQKEKSADFKSPDLGNSAYTLIQSVSTRAPVSRAACHLTDFNETLLV